MDKLTFYKYACNGNNFILIDETNKEYVLGSKKLNFQNISVVRLPV